nr:PREDICTED: ribosome-binding protein 1-like [Megachile rotundata]
MTDKQSRGDEAGNNVPQAGVKNTQRGTLGRRQEQRGQAGVRNRGELTRMESIKGYKGSKITSEDINKLLREAARNIEEKTSREKRAEEETRKSGSSKASNSKGHSRKREAERGEVATGEPKKGRGLEDKREEEEEEIVLMEAAEAAEASMCELEDMEWEEEFSQDWTEPIGSSTPRTNECEETKRGKGGQGKAKRKLPLVLEDKIVGTKGEDLKKLQPIVREEKRRMEEKRKEQKSSGKGDEKKNGGESGVNQDGVRTGVKESREKTGSGEPPKMEGMNRDKRGEGYKSDVVILVQYPRKEVDYWNAIRWLKTKIHNYTEGLKEIRETRKGDIIIILQRGKEGSTSISKKCAEAINKEGGGKWIARMHTDRVEVAVKVSDPDLEKEELMEAFKKGGLEDLVEKEEICFKHIGGREGTCHRTAFLECTRAAAKRLTQEKGLRTKWQELRPYFPRRKQEGNAKGKDRAKGNEARESGEKRKPKPGTSKDPW